MKHMKKINNIIGGALEYKDDGLFSYVTDCGDSSTRLAVRSLGKRTKYFLPDYLCSHIANIFEQENSRFEYYHINKDMTIDEKVLRKVKDKDVLYVIDFFGHRDSLLAKLKNPKFMIIEDAIFAPYVEKPANIARWISFSSFRKISHIADGSLTKSTQKLNGVLIQKEESPFSEAQYDYKKIKYEYIHEGKHKMADYMHFDVQFKKLHANQRVIRSMSHKSMANLIPFLLNYDEEHRKRKANYAMLVKMLGKKCIRRNPEYFSYCVLSVDRRDELRRHLYKKDIYLAVHWPNMKNLDNELYDREISIPVDSRYIVADMKRIAGLINKFYR